MKSIKNGYPKKGMLPYGSGATLSKEKLLQLASFIVSIKGSNPAQTKPIDKSRGTKHIE